ncbi:MAG: 8-amino-7-oxononanoate synthase [Candidatus Omnitrophica bacterium]|nr:8-amino-7-oxononanoate synthase [Candidatus Omnitrophota bacterium]
MAELKNRHLHRELTCVSSAQGPRLSIGRGVFVNFSSNNYLGLSTHPRVKKSARAAVSRWGTGSGASRLISGDLAIHGILESKLASFKQEEAALVFSSGYLANLGAVTALVNENDVVLVDRLNHASIIDAARLSKAKLWVYPHLDLGELEKLLDRAQEFRRRLVITDAYFGMDGHVVALDALHELCRRKSALLMIDEAHSTGVFGKNGRGLTEHFGLSGKIDVVMGTLSKALGSVGGFIAGSEVLIEYLVNRSREFIFTTAPSPAASAAALASLEVILEEKSRRTRLWDNAGFLRRKLSGLGFDLMGSEGPVLPLRIGDSQKALLVRELLWKEGLFVACIRPPTVPKGTDRIRVSVMATHTQEDLERLVSAMKKAGEKIL